MMARGIGAVARSLVVAGVVAALVVGYGREGYGGVPDPGPGAIGGRYLLGANYPYLAYGNDFGANAWGSYGVHHPATYAAIDADFERMAAMGVITVRWFVFADGRAGIVFAPDGTPTGLDDDVFRDLDAALAIATRHGIMLDLVLLDFLFMHDATYDAGVQLGGHAAVITTAAGRQAFLDVVLTPLLRRYGAASAIHTWEVMNEPEWAMVEGDPDDQVTTPATLADFRDFVRAVATAVHGFSGALVTVGSASARWAGYWTGLGLDYYQIHYYDWMRGLRQHDLFALRAVELRLDHPVVVGEFPASGSRTADLAGYLDRWYASGYAGAWFWSFTGTDQWGSADAAAFGAWARSHPTTVAPAPAAPPCATP